MRPRDLPLAPAAGLFGSLVAIRNKLYDHGLLKRTRLEAPVISVGNLAMGGAGKSPIVADLANRFAATGKRVAILSRGYGRLEPHSSREVLRGGDWQLYGDEPAMLAIEAPDARIFVGPSRAKAAELARDWKPDLYLVDDGFQHRALHRDLDLVLLDLTQGPPRLFPLGMFREGWRSLRRADAVLLTRWDGGPTDYWEQTIHTVKPMLPIQRIRFEPAGLYRLDGSLYATNAQLAGMPLAAYAGIANPGKFFVTLTSNGVSLVEVMSLSDHENVDKKRLEDFALAAKQAGARAIVTTAKDAVKLAYSFDFGIVFTFLKLKVTWEAPDPIHRFSAFLKQR